ncbi:MAG TPA: hypothetical protein VGA49_03590 [Patescibacteria group bacterium]
MTLENKFPKKAKDEKFILILRRHWFVFFYNTLFYALLGLIPVGLYFLFKTFSPEIFTNQNTRALIILGAGAYYLFVWGFYYIYFVNHILDVWIVTTYRIINIEQKTLFARSWSEQNLDVVQDVTVSVAGFFPTVLGYGDITIQTAGAKIFFIFKQIPDPYKVSKKIIELVEKFKHRNVNN